MSYLKDKFKQWLKLDDDIDNGNVGNACQARVNVNADEAYRLTRYGQIKSDNTLLVEFFDRVHRMIAGRTAMNKFFGIIDIDIDIIPFLSEIKTKLIEKGYKVIIFGNNSVIMTDGTESKLGGVSTFIMILWDRESTKEVKEMKVNVIPDSSTFQSDMATRSFETVKQPTLEIGSDTVDAGNPDDDSEQIIEET